MIDWRKGSCSGSKDPEFLRDDDDEIPLSSHAQIMCAMCPINPECLNFALDHETRGGEAGVWGGTTPRQRRLMKVPRERQSCPVCQADAVVSKGRGEICISCGASWLI